MNHIDDDLLLKIALGLLEEGEEAAPRGHLSGCEECREKLARIRSDMELIGSLEPGIERPLIPLPRRRGPRMRGWLKVAALLAFGFMSGYGVSRIVNHRVVYVVPQHARLSRTMQTYSGFTHSEPVDLDTGFPGRGPRAGTGGGE